MVTLASPDRIQARPAAERQRLKLEKFRRTPESPPLAILVVEDNPADLYLIRTSLHAEEPGCVITIAEDGDAAIQFLALAKPDLVILDLNIPRRNGLEVLAHIRGDANLRDVVVIIFSSSPKEAIEQDAPEADAHIQKPFELDLFLQMGKQVMQCFHRKKERISSCG